MHSYAKSTIVVAAAALLAANPVAAHMEMKYPAPVFSQFNDFNGGNILNTYTAPMSGRDQFPCRDASVLQAIGTEAGTAVDSWAQGSAQSITITGGAFHGGGSCQFSLSYDQGSTFKVIKSYIGNCPSTNGDSSYDITVPNDAPSGEAVFAWSWFNKIGNREMYMNCAIVNIGGSSKREVKSEENVKRAAAFSLRPNIFVANIDGASGCRTQEMIDVDFPNPGDEVERNTEVPGLYIDEASCADSGNTGAGTPGPAGDDSGNDSGNDTGDDATSASVEVPTQSTTTMEATSAEETSTTAVATTPSIPGGVFITTSVGATTATEDVTATSTTIVATGVPEETDAPTETGAPIETGVPEEIDAPTETDSPAETDTPIETDAPTVTEIVSAQPTTLETSTRVVSTTTEAAVPSSTAPATSAGTFPAGEACDEEGAWNCIDGAFFQRCGSGQWTEVMAMAAGTSCQPGVSSTLIWRRREGGFRFHRS